MKINKVCQHIDRWYRMVKHSVPIDLERIEDIHDKDIRESFPKDISVLVYHGTSSKRLANIKMHTRVSAVL